MGHPPTSRRTVQNTCQSGFSMIELMTVLSIVAILLGIAVPSFASLIRDTKLVVATNDFFSSINLARSEAIQRGMRIDMVPLDQSGDWAKGWTVLVDENNNQKIDAAESVIFSHGPVSPGVKIDATLTDSPAQYLAYNAAGRSRTNASNYRTQFGTITFELAGKARKIKLNFLGRPRICNPENERHTC